MLNGDEQSALDSDVAGLHTDRYTPALASYQSVPPHGSVEGWVVIAMAWPPSGATPQLNLTVREAVGTSYLTVVPHADRQVPRS